MGTQSHTTFQELNVVPPSHAPRPPPPPPPHQLTTPSGRRLCGSGVGWDGVGWGEGWVGLGFELGGKLPANHNSDLLSDSHRPDPPLLAVNWIPEVGGLLIH